MKSVLVLGGYGGFGARLCQRLAADGWHVIVAGRNLAKARAVASKLASGRAVVADRTGDLSVILAENRPLLVIDAAGPFQDSDYRVAEACIAHGAHYLDLADARQFVCEIGALDEAAHSAGVTVVAGASSVPALSGAVIRELAEGFDRIGHVGVAISASDKAVAGTSVSTAILSYVGKPLPLWTGRREEQRAGWQDVSTLKLAGHDTPPFARLVALADVPDLAIWPRRLPGTPSTIFKAGPEFAFQVRSLWVLSWLVRLRFVGSLAPLSSILRPLQLVTRRFSDGRSAMTVELCGYDNSGSLRRRWELLATDGVGPEIPVLAAQLIARKVAEGEFVAGARDAHDALTLSDFQPLFEELGIRCVTLSAPHVPLYKRVLGDKFEQLPAPIRAMHEVCGAGAATGQATVERGRGLLARLVGALMRFPPAGDHLLDVTFTEVAGREKWTRDFSGKRFHSELCGKDGRLTERFGAMRFHFDLPVSPRGLEMLIKRWTIFGVPMPLFLAPKVEASETVENGRFAFDVAIALPLIGTIVHYRGTLA